jgi:hypothetical protein
VTPRNALWPDSGSMRGLRLGKRGADVFFKLIQKQGMSRQRVRGGLDQAGRLPGHIPFSKARELPADKDPDPLVQDVKKALDIQLIVAYYVVSQVKYFHIFGDLLSHICILQKSASM